jgi:metal-responsive CopG/Arc/MetJ family transcriptional regulator
MANEHKPPPQVAATKVNVSDVALDKDLLDWIDARAERQGVTRTVVIETALKQYRESHRPGRKGTSWN